MRPDVRCALLGFRRPLDSSGFVSHTELEPGAAVPDSLHNVMSHDGSHD
jgi:hypothetical protein